MYARESFDPLKLRTYINKTLKLSFSLFLTYLRINIYIYHTIDINSKFILYLNFIPIRALLLNPQQTSFRNHFHELYQPFSWIFPSFLQIIYFFFFSTNNSRSSLKHSIKQPSSTPVFQTLSRIVYTAPSSSISHGTKPNKTRTTRELSIRGRFMGRKEGRRKDKVVRGRTTKRIYFENRPRIGVEHDRAPNQRGLKRRRR